MTTLAASPTGPSLAHLLAIGRAATAPALMDYDLSNVQHPLFEHVWAGWAQMWTDRFVGGLITLLRHEDTGEWATVYYRAEEPYPLEPVLAPYDFADWDILDRDERRMLLFDHTTPAFTGATLTALVDRAVDVVFGPEDGWEDPPAPGLLALPATIHAVTSCGLPEAAEVAVMIGLGGYNDIGSLVPELVDVDAEALRDVLDTD